MFDIFPISSMYVCIPKCIMRRRRKIACLVQYGLAAAVVMFMLHPERNARGRYQHLTRAEILSSLVPAVSRNLSESTPVECDYRALLSDETPPPQRPEPRSAGLLEGQHIREGGEYMPCECKPQFSTAVIVPYRQRTEQLHRFLLYMHSYLRRQNIHYRIYIIEQFNVKAFNRAKLLNIGAVRAARDGFPCLVLHDVDLLPLHPSNLYACTTRPRHMSCSINKFRFTLPYLSLFGGAVAILASQFTAVNGMSNEYFGWGAEDDDFSERIKANGLLLCRFEPDISRYFMVNHRAQSKGKKNKLLLSQAANRMQTDGLNSLQYSEVSTVLHPLFTHVMVDF